MVEMCTIMSDYRKAYHYIHDFVVDFKATEQSKLLHITPQETMRFISISLYLMEKLKMHQFQMDLFESFVVNTHIMTRCNPFSMYYITQHTKTNPKLKNIHRYQSNEMKGLNDKILKWRLRLRKHFIENPMFAVFTGISPAQALDNEWVEIVANFSEAISDHFVFIRAC